MGGKTKSVLKVVCGLAIGGVVGLCLGPVGAAAVRLAFAAETIGAACGAVVGGITAYATYDDGKCATEQPVISAPVQPV